MSVQAIQDTARDGEFIASSAAFATDAGGNSIFSVGDAGAAHVMAHRLFDEGRSQLGRRWLGRWLERNAGWGSEWVHLEFHMALFELESGDWPAAFVRFRNEILPAAATTELALTDAPALLWKLALRAETRVGLPWQSLRRTAQQRLLRPADSFVTLHNLLALAGAGDAAGIRQWLNAPAAMGSPEQRAILGQIADALVESLVGRYDHAAGGLRAILPELHRLGGSRAQNALFAELESCWRRLAQRAAASGAMPQAA